MLLFCSSAQNFAIGIGATGAADVVTLGQFTAIAALLVLRFFQRAVGTTIVAPRR